MGPEKFSLRALERMVYRSVDELVDDCYPYIHREPLERMVTGRFATMSELALRNLKIELVHQNYARLSGTFTAEVQEGRNQWVRRDIPVVVEGLWDFSPRNWAFRLDIVHMRAETDDQSLADFIVGDLLTSWDRMPAFGRFRYRRGVFYVALDPAPELAPAAAVG